MPRLEYVANCSCLEGLAEDERIQNTRVAGSRPALVALVRSRYEPGEGARLKAGEAGGVAQRQSLHLARGRPLAPPTLQKKDSR